MSYTVIDGVVICFYWILKQVHNCNHNTDCGLLLVCGTDCLMQNHPASGVSAVCQAIGNYLKMAPYRHCSLRQLLMMRWTTTMKMTMDSSDIFSNLIVTVTEKIG